MTREEEIKAIQNFIEALDMAIKALKFYDKAEVVISQLRADRDRLLAEPCEDAISREAVDKYIVELLSGYLYEEERERLEKLSAYLWELPPVQPKIQTGEWIPVSERLPEDGQSVLFCDIDNDIMVGYHVKGRPDTHFSQDGTFDDMKNVTAWMPLPEPYTAESEDK